MVEIYMLHIIYNNQISNNQYIYMNNAGGAA